MSHDACFNEKIVKTSVNNDRDIELWQQKTEQEISIQNGKYIKEVDSGNINLPAGKNNEVGQENPAICLNPAVMK